MVIGDANEDDFVWNNIGTTASYKGGEHNEYLSNHVFIGGSDREVEGLEMDRWLYMVIF